MSLKLTFVEVYFQSNKNFSTGATCKMVHIVINFVENKSNTILFYFVTLYYAICKSLYHLLFSKVNIFVARNLNETITNVIQQNLTGMLKCNITLKNNG